MSRMTTIWAIAALAAGFAMMPAFAGEQGSGDKGRLPTPMSQAKSHECCPAGTTSHTAFEVPTGMERKGGPRSARSQATPAEPREGLPDNRIKPHIGPPSKGTGR